LIAVDTNDRLFDLGKRKYDGSETTEGTIGHDDILVIVTIEELYLWLSYVSSELKLQQYQATNQMQAPRGLNSDSNLSDLIFELVRNGLMVQALELTRVSVSVSKSVRHLTQYSKMMTRVSMPPDEASICHIIAGIAYLSAIQSGLHPIQLRNTNMTAMIDNLTLNYHKNSSQSRNVLSTANQKKCLDNITLDDSEQELTYDSSPAQIMPQSLLRYNGWNTLLRILNCFDNPKRNFKFHLIAFTTILNHFNEAKNPLFCLPECLVQVFLLDHSLARPSGASHYGWITLLNFLIANHKLFNACDLSIRYLQLNSYSPPVRGHRDNNTNETKNPSRYLPYTALDELFVKCKNDSSSAFKSPLYVTKLQEKVLELEKLLEKYFAKLILEEFESN
jgi:hypothetical protein